MAINKTVARQLAAAATIAILFCTPTSAKDRDYEYWFKTAVRSELTDDWGFRFTEKLTWTDNANEFRKHMSDIGFVYHGFADWLDLGLNFKKAFEKENGRWLEENRPHINLTLKDQLFGLSVSNRNRIEFRDEDEGRDYWRYRNKLTLASPNPLTALQIKPYVAHEFFINLDPSEFDQYRFYAGFSLKTTKTMSLDLYYVWDIERDNRRWEEVNVIGTDLKFRF